MERWGVDMMVVWRDGVPTARNPWLLGLFQAGAEGIGDCLCFEQGFEVEFCLLCLGDGCFLHFLGEAVGEVRGQLFGSGEGDGGIACLGCAKVKPVPACGFGLGPVLGFEPGDDYQVEFTAIGSKGCTYPDGVVEGFDTVSYGRVFDWAFDEAQVFDVEIEISEILECDGQVVAPFFDLRMCCVGDGGHRQKDLEVFVGIFICEQVELALVCFLFSFRLEVVVGLEFQ